MFAKSRTCCSTAARLALVGMIVAAAPSAVSATVRTSTPATTEAAALTTALRAELGALPPTAAVEDMEASIVYVLGQGRYSSPDITQALNNLGGGDASGALKSAVSHVRLALLSRKFKRGTGALGDGGGGFGFSSPIVSIGGGGSSNYSK